MTEDSFGRRLRSERERRRIALEAIAANTKISIGLLQGLERDDLTRWPSGIFRRSFIRSYAEAIGLDGDEVMREFLERFPDPQDIKVVAGPGHAGPAKASIDALAPAACGPATFGPAKAGHYVLRQHRQEPVLRLTLADPRPPFWGGAVLSKMRARVAASAWDAGTLLALGLAAYMVFERFWTPLAIAALGYYVGGILILGNTPGVCLFAPRLRSEKAPLPVSAETDLFGELTSEPSVLLNLDRIRS